MMTDQPNTNPTIASTQKALRGVLYLRVQANADSRTLDEQRKGLQDYVATRDDLRIVAEYSDRCSALADIRPGLDAALADARASSYDVLLIEGPDRVSRSTAAFWDRMTPFIRSGVAIMSRSHHMVLSMEVPEGTLFQAQPPSPHKVSRLARLTGSFAGGKKSGKGTVPN